MDRLRNYTWAAMAVLFAAALLWGIYESTPPLKVPIMGEVWQTRSGARCMVGMGTGGGQVEYVCEHESGTGWDNETHRMPLDEFMARMCHVDAVELGRAGK